MQVTHVITSLETGGAETTLYRLCAMRRPDELHTVISLTGRGTYGPRLEAIGVTVHSLDMPRGRVTFAGLRRLYSVLRRLKPAVVQTWMYHSDLLGGLIARMLGVRHVIWTIRGPLDRRVTSSATMMVVRLCAKLSRLVPSRIVSCSELAARVHREAGYQASKFVVIPNGYPLDSFRPQPSERDRVRRELKLDGSSTVIGMVARFDPYKDHANLIHALGILRRGGGEFVCVLVGAGMQESNAELRTLIEHEGIADRVRLSGPRDDIPALMNALDLHILSSLGEAFPNVLGEAMACGTPCVTTDVGDARLIVGETGWIVSPSDPQALADSIATAQRAMEQADSWRQRQSDCRTRVVARFDVETMAAAYRAVWVRDR